MIFWVYVLTLTWYNVNKTREIYIHVECNNFVKIIFIISDRAMHILEYMYLNQMKACDIKEIIKNQVLSLRREQDPVSTINTAIACNQLPELTII